MGVFLGGVFCNRVEVVIGWVVIGGGCLVLGGGEGVGVGGVGWVWGGVEALVGYLTRDLEVGGLRVGGVVWGGALVWGGAVPPAVERLHEVRDVLGASKTVAADAGPVIDLFFAHFQVVSDLHINIFFMIGFNGCIIFLALSAQGFIGTIDAQLPAPAAIQQSFSGPHVVPIEF